MVAGAAPPASMIEGMERMGWEVTHVYGLTEVYGPASVCAKHDDWEELTLAERVDRNGRQGVRYQLQQGLTVVDPNDDAGGAARRRDDGRGDVPRQHRDEGLPEEPERPRSEAFRDGWFHTGDLGVLHPDGYVKLKDRAKDIIISGGENISSIEVEDALYKHPAVLACAVVARSPTRSGARRRWPSSKSSRNACRPRRRPSRRWPTELIEHCRAHLARFKCPREVRFAVVPKTSTGKIQKHVLREQHRFGGRDRLSTVGRSAAPTRVLSRVAGRHGVPVPLHRRGPRAPHRCHRHRRFRGPGPGFAASGPCPASR